MLSRTTSHPGVANGRGVAPPPGLRSPEAAVLIAVPRRAERRSKGDGALTATEQPGRPGGPSPRSPIAVTRRAARPSWYARTASGDRRACSTGVITPRARAECAAPPDGPGGGSASRTGWLAHPFPPTAQFATPEVGARAGAESFASLAWSRSRACKRAGSTRSKRGAGLAL